MLTDVLAPLVTYPDATSAQVAAALPRFIEGFATTVTFITVEINVPDLADRWGSNLVALPQMIAEVETRSRLAAEGFKQATTVAIDTLEVRHQMVRSILGSVPSLLVRHARQHDLCLLPVAKGSSEKSTLAEVVIFGSGRPVMLVPETALEAYDVSKVAIAWDGGRCAGRAVFDALPILAKAREVVVLTASLDKPNAISSVAELTAYLRRHGIVASHVEVAEEEREAGLALQDTAISLGAGILVMGAYGHNRFREFVFGGVTKTVIGGPSLPVFLSH